MKTLVTNKELEIVGESLISDYIRSGAPEGRCVDIEGFIEDYLHLPIVYENIAENDMDKIGFVSDGHYPLKVRENGTVMEKVFPKGTIVIDNYLLYEENSSQRRFTLAHECSHVIFECLCPTMPGPCFNRHYDSERAYDLKEFRQSFNLCEIQTDRLAAVLLMPQFLVKRIMQEFEMGEALPIYSGSIVRPRDKLTVQNMADAMGVSYTALLNRLRELNMLDHHSMEEYLKLEMRFEVENVSASAC